MKLIMTRIRLNIAILAIMSFAVPSWAADAGRRLVWPTEIEPPGLKRCTVCHSASLQGLQPAPRLAGQTYQYLWNQLVDLQVHRRNDPNATLFMWPVVSTLPPETARDLARYFSTIPPEAANDGDTELVASGRTIYQEGIPDANVVACVACHGPNAEGVGEIPRLGGLAYPYLERRLRQWGQGYNRATRPPMPHIASELSPNQITALASYLSFVK